MEDLSDDCIFMVLDKVKSKCLPSFRLTCRNNDFIISLTKKRIKPYKSQHFISSFNRFIFGHHSLGIIDLGLFIFFESISKGNLEILKYFYENKPPGDMLYTGDAAYFRAAEGGHLEVLKYLHEKNSFFRFTSLCWSTWVCGIAAKGGHLECLKYARENGCPWDDWTCDAAAAGGHLEILKYAHENGCPWDVHTCANAAEKGQLECLRYARERGCPWNELTYIMAEDEGHLEILNYLIENECPRRP